MWLLYLLRFVHKLYFLQGCPNVPSPNWRQASSPKISTAPRIEDCVGCKRCESACPTDFLSIHVLRWRTLNNAASLHNFYDVKLLRSKVPRITKSSKNYKNMPCTLKTTTKTTANDLVDWSRSTNHSEVKSKLIRICVTK